MRVNRRAVLVGAAAGGGLLAMWTFLPRQYPIPLPAGPGEHAFNAWLKVGRDGIVTVAVPLLEMGQGVTTLLPKIAALELGADWRQIAVEPAAISAAYADPVLAAHWSSLWSPRLSALADDPDEAMAGLFARRETLVATADGTGLPAYEAPLRAAAASLRAMLSQAAAERWGVPAEAVEAEGGFVTYADKRLRFAQLVDAAAELTPPDPPPLRPDPVSDVAASELFEDEQRFPRLDAPAKIDGSFPFAGDIRLPEMVYARIAQGPLADARLEGYDADAPRGVSGYMGRVAGDTWLAAIANNGFAAEQALAAMKPRFAPRGSLPDDRTIAEALTDALKSTGGERSIETSDPDPLLDAPGTLSASYTIAPALHGTLETATVTARFADGRLELWFAAQAPQRARRAAAEALGIGLDDVVLYPVAAGGSFDARLDHRIVRQAAAIARSFARPVQLSYSREIEHVTTLPRAPSVTRMTGIAGADGSILALRSRTATAPSAREMYLRLFSGMTAEAAMAEAAGGADPLPLEGSPPPYQFAALAMETVPAAIGIPVGRMRGNADLRAAFAMESFADEMARASGEEPLSFRIAMLRGNIRMVECLQGVAQLAGWDGATAGSGEGLACWQMADPAGREDGGGRIAVIARAAPGDAGLEIVSLTAFCDIGRIIDRDIAAQQIEGGLIYGLGQALGGAARYARGLPRSLTMGSLNLPTLARAPEITVAFADSGAPPFDPGELGVVAAPPAIANALHASDGKRYRSLPIRLPVPPPPAAEPDTDVSEGPDAVQPDAVEIDEGGELQPPPDDSSL